MATGTERNAVMDTVRRLLFDLVGVFLDDGIGEDFAGDALDLGTSSVGPEAVGQRKRKILALAHGGHIGKSDFAESVVDGLALRVEDRCLGGDIDMRLHDEIIEAET